MTKIFVREKPAEGLFRLSRDLKKRLTKVMRLKKGDELQVFGKSGRWQCKITEIFPNEIMLNVLEEFSVPPRSGPEIILGQALPKGDRFDWLIEKATELGASEIHPLVTERTVVRPSNVPSKIQRWNQIAEQAAAQSENAYPPLINGPQTLQQFLNREHEGLKLLLHERGETRSLHSILTGGHPQRILFAVGPEGGWSSIETNQLINAGFVKVHLGNRILRADTAGLALLAILQYELGDFR